MDLQNALAQLRKLYHFPGAMPDVAPQPHGWFGGEHMEILSCVLNETTKVVLELGSWLGKSTRWIAGQAPGAAVIAVDHWRGSNEHQKSKSWAPMLPRLYDSFLRSCWDFREQIIPVRANSLAGCRIVHVHGIRPDVVYIDASHEYEEVRDDLALVLELFPEALVVGDDYKWPGVGRAVQEAVAAGKLKAAFKGNVWWRASDRIHPEGAAEVKGRIHA